MNKKCIIFIFIVVYSLLSISAQNSSYDDLSQENKSLFETYILRFYSQQNMTGSSGRLLEDVILKQEIQTSDSKKTEIMNVLLFVKNPKVSLVYATDNSGKPTAYLQRDNETWIYRENLRLPLKISLSQSVSGEANLGDILGMNLIDDFSCVNVEQNSETVSFTFDRLKSNLPYSTIEVNASKTTKDIFSIKYLGMGGSAIRMAELDNYFIVRTDHRLPIWSISNLHMNVDRVTKIKYLDVKRMSIPDSFFQPNATALAQFLIWARGFK